MHSKGRDALAPGGRGKKVRGNYLGGGPVDVLRSFRRCSHADSAVGPSAPPGSHSAPPAYIIVLEFELDGNEAKQIASPCSPTAKINLPRFYSGRLLATTVDN